MKQRESQDGSAATSSGYRCYLLDGDNRIVRRIDLAASSDGTAIAEAQLVLDGTESPAAEVWCLGRVVGRIARRSDSGRTG